MYSFFVAMRITNIFDTVDVIGLFCNFLSLSFLQILFCDNCLKIVVIFLNY